MDNNDSNNFNIYNNNSIYHDSINNNKIALFIDAENISSVFADKILSELEKRGTLIIRRAYADWTKSIVKPNKKKQETYNLWEVLNGWYTILADKGIIAMHQPQNTYGKNSSDIYLIIDAMDVLYAGIADTFCIVSSDGDFTRLATRLLEGGKKVIIMGEAQTPRSVRRIGEFILLENAKSTTAIKPISADLTRDISQNQRAQLPVILPKLVQIAGEHDKDDDIPTSAENIAPKQFPQQIKQPQHQLQQIKPNQNNQNQPKSSPNLQQSQAKVQAKQVEKPYSAKIDAKNYDELIKHSILEILTLYKNEDGEITYQRLLSLLRKKHPDCEVIKVGENPIELFKSLPYVKCRLENATYFFSLPKNESIAVVSPRTSNVAKSVIAHNEKTEDKSFTAEQVLKFENGENSVETKKPVQRRRRSNNQNNLKAEIAEEKIEVKAEENVESAISAQSELTEVKKASRTHKSVNKDNKDDKQSDAQKGIPTVEESKNNEEQKTDKALETAIAPKRGRRKKVTDDAKKA